MVLLTNPTLESTYCCVQPTPQSHSGCHSPHPPQLPNHAPLPGTRHRQQCLSKLVLPTSPSNLVAQSVTALYGCSALHTNTPQSSTSVPWPSISLFYGALRWSQGGDQIRTQLLNCVPSQKKDLREKVCAAQRCRSPGILRPRKALNKRLKNKSS